MKILLGRKNEKTIVLVAMLLSTIMLAVSCCSCSQEDLAQQTPTMLTWKAYEQVIQTRIASFENTLKMIVEFEGTGTPQGNNSYFIRDFYFKITVENIVDRPIIFRKPITYGFLGFDEYIYNDLLVSIGRQDGGPLYYNSTTNYPSTPLGEQTAPLPTVSDLVVLKEGEHISFPISVQLHGVYFKDTGYHGILPAGSYEITVNYINFTLGYDLPMEHPVTPIVEPTAGYDWYFTNNYKPDLNVWVGEITSNTLTINVPDK
jgi:hypothetical protein